MAIEIVDLPKMIWGKNYLEINRMIFGFFGTMTGD